MPAGNAFSKTVLGALSALLVACAALPGTDLTFRINPRTGAVEPVNPAGPIAVKLVLEPQAPIRETLAVPSNWASIKVTLTNATLLAADKVTTINQAAGSTVPASGAVFSNLRTGSGYAVSVLLYSANDLGGTLLSRGTTSGVTLNAGSNTVTISLLDATTINGAVSDGVPSSITVGGVTINLNAPIGVVTDSSGNAFFADASCRIFKRASSGTYSVLAGSGTCATSTECSQTTNGHPGTTCDGTGASAKLGTPQNMTIDSSGNIYFSETGGKCLLRRSNPGGTVETLLGNGCGYSNATSYGAKFENPEGVLRDSAGDIIISDTGNHKLRKVFVSDGQPSNSFEVGGNAGYANNASGKSGVKFSSPKGICFDSTGN
ncbi:MAG: hypothetical protein FJZ00_14655, partial [Candidatus Sericytochromatia bacterium]|nr:hypothetical protein [Candidatus Tanganyikabacteria bacterium]